MVGSIKEALAEVEKVYKSVAMSSVKKVTDEVCQDMYKFAVSTIDRYYANYEPERYLRDYDLYNTLSPIAKVSDSGNAIQCVVGVSFNGGAVDGKTGSSKYPSGASGTWIVENFLNGIHPATNGARVPEYVVYMPITDSMSAGFLLNKYIDSRGPKMQNEIQKNIILNIVSRL